MSEVDDVRDLIAVLEQVVLDHLAGHRIRPLGGAGIDLEIELAEQRRRLLEHRRVRPQLRLGLDANGDARERALEAAIDDLPDVEAGDLHARFFDEPGGVVEDAPDAIALIAADALGDEVEREKSEQSDEERGDADLDRRRRVLHVSPGRVSSSSPIS